jgi:hypothetical protein
MVPTAIYIHTEGMGKIRRNIFETNYLDDAAKTNVLGFRNSNFSYGIQRYLFNDHTYDKLSGKTVEKCKQ